MLDFLKEKRQNVYSHTRIEQTELKVEMSFSAPRFHPLFWSFPHLLQRKGKVQADGMMKSTLLGFLLLILLSLAPFLRCSTLVVVA